MKNRTTFMPMLALLLALAAMAAMTVRHAAAQGPTDPPPPPEAPIFGLPFAGPPGPDTWNVTQWYGNTRFAYLMRRTFYGNGQGLHFGLDLGAPCGTEVIAIGDGIVTKIDAMEHGSGPHNLMIDHPEGYSSFYGHLLEPPRLYIGQEVHRGDVIALTGDPDLTCDSRPHLHLEIRNHWYNYAYNPVEFIDADWDSLALFGPRSSFSRDLDNPRRWVTPYDQPMTDFGGELLNNYLNAWPPDYSR